jgi:hypothetical protein
MKSSVPRLVILKLENGKFPEAERNFVTWQGCVGCSTMDIQSWKQMCPWYRLKWCISTQATKTVVRVTRTGHTFIWDLKLTWRWRFMLWFMTTCRQDSCYIFRRDYVQIPVRRPSIINEASVVLPSALVSSRMWRRVVWCKFTCVSD